MSRLAETYGRIVTRAMRPAFRNLLNPPLKKVAAASDALREDEQRHFDKLRVKLESIETRMDTIDRKADSTRGDVLDTLRKLRGQTQYVLESVGGSGPAGDGENVLDAYHKWYYNTKLWTKTSFLGIPCQKSIADIWLYQEILSELKPSLVVEFGTKSGGSAAFFATVLGQVNPDSCVLTVDVSDRYLDPSVAAHERIEVLQASSTDARVAARIRELRRARPGPMFAILDSDHHKDHVLAELLALRELTRPGDYVVVEDTNINGHPVAPDWGEGPMEALCAYEQRHPDDYEHDRAREGKFGFTFAPNGFLIRR